MTDTYQDVLDVLAANEGACLYWQMPNVERGKSAAMEGVVAWDGDLLVHPFAVKVEYPAPAYIMPTEPIEP